MCSEVLLWWVTLFRVMTVMTARVNCRGGQSWQTTFREVQCTLFWVGHDSSSCLVIARLELLPTSGKKDLVDIVQDRVWLGLGYNQILVVKVAKLLHGGGTGSV